MAGWKTTAHLAACPPRCASHCAGWPDPGSPDHRCDLSARRVFLPPGRRPTGSDCRSRAAGVVRRGRCPRGGRQSAPPRAGSTRSSRPPVARCSRAPSPWRCSTTPPRRVPQPVVTGRNRCAVGHGQLGPLHTGESCVRVPPCIPERATSRSPVGASRWRYERQAAERVVDRGGDPWCRTLERDSQRPIRRCCAEALDSIGRGCADHRVAGRHVRDEQRQHRRVRVTRELADGFGLQPFVWIACSGERRIEVESAQIPHGACRSETHLWRNVRGQHSQLRERRACAAPP